MGMRKRVVVLGCGFGGLKTLLTLHRKGGRHLELVGINKRPFLYNYPILPRLLTRSLPEEAVLIPLQKRLQGTGITLLVENALAVDASRQAVITTQGAIEYDYLVLALGVKAKSVARGEETPLFFPKSLRHLYQLKTFITKMLQQGGGGASFPRPKLTLAVIGGGLTGVEFSACLRAFLDQQTRALRLPQETASLLLLERKERIAEECPPEVSEAITHSLLQQGITLKLHTDVWWVEQQLLLSNQGSMQADGILCCIGTEWRPTVDLKELESTAQGIPVNRYLQVPQHPSVFAVGDNAVFRPHGVEIPLPRRASVAFQQAKTVAENILRDIRGLPPHPYVPRPLPLAVTLGPHQGLIEYRGWLTVGRLAGKIKAYYETCCL
ncbi:MAG: hypothetical protein D6736_04585 [Nitrospinota bacterium]|nr:MAG: hypothetical protein D6736_04585 [Nitrospinota bacterium]